MTGNAGDWVREGTPRDADAEWADDQTDYGTAVSPEEWDDYSSEQSVPVVPPAAASAEPAEPAAPVEPVEPVEPETVELGDEADPRWEHFDAPSVPADAEGDGFVDRTASDYDEAATPQADELPAEQTGSQHHDVGDDGSAGVPADAEAVAPEPTGATVASDWQEPEAPVDPVVVHDASVHGETADLPDEGVAVADIAPDEPADVAAQETLVADAEAGLDETPEAHGATAVDESLVDAGADDTDAAFRSPSDAPAVDPMAEDDPDATQVYQANFDDVDDTTRVRPVVAGAEPSGVGATAATAVAAGAAGAAAGASTLPAGLYRNNDSDDTQILATPTTGGYPDLDEQEAEERRLQAQLAAERQARNQRLGVVDTSDANETRAASGFVKLNTDRFFPSFGLFVLRVITAGILGIAGYRILTAIPATAETLGATMIPEPRLAAWILGFTLGALALLLVIGMLQRLVGFLLLAIAVASLVFLRWGNFNIFSASFEGFPMLGDKELLLAGIGLLLLSMGGGSWGVDGAFRRSRANARAEKAA